MAFHFIVSVDPSGARPPDPKQVRSASGAGNRLVIGGFSDVTGLGAETEVETLRAGGVNNAEITLPGPTKFSSRLVLKRGIGHPAMLWAWYRSIVQGAIKRQDVTIYMLGEDSRDTDRTLAWTFSEACPVKWSGPELHGGASAVAFESIELIHKGFVLPGVAG